MRVFIVGNGTSRRGFDLNELRGKGRIVGCNESYKEFPYFDMVASIDGGSTLDIQKNWKGLHAYKWRNNWFRSDTGEDLGQLIGSHNSGQLALRAAVEFWDPEEIYLIGIDFGGPRVYGGRPTGEPSNKCWETWNKWMQNRNVIQVGVNSSEKKIDYNELRARLSLW